ncbi:hypothetical protein pVco14_084 [Vibrio phage pVco-14]|nr:hypothetical protein pVco14_084 [Vibrio phage pVco-14]
MITYFGHFVGLVGMAMVVIAFYKTVDGKWDSQGEQFNVVNLCGAVLLLISLCINFNLGSFVIELFWIAISLKGLVQLRRNNHEFKTPGAIADVFSTIGKNICALGQNLD